MHLTSRIPTIGRNLLLLYMFALAACAHPGPDSLSSTTGTGGGDGEATITFDLSNLEGDWVGQLIPDNLARPERNFYVRIAAGAVTEAADSLGNEWKGANSTRTLDFSEAGVMQTIMESTVFTNTMVMDAQMDDAMSTLTGTFSHLAPDGALIEGSFVLVHSIGSGHFPDSLISGVWDGFGANEMAKRRTFTATLDTDGTVLSGEIRRPDNDELIHSYATGSGVFAYSDSAIGRIDDVVILGDDGSTLTFVYLLVDEEGSLLGGPGFDSQLGAGVVELNRIAVAPR
ncbi:MAG: hypothetical protein O3A95_00105 [Planctomycetota bacterium]|nr:hypothetical protein [Planctomycetota bacterium]MDA1112691.1 hypothetical protein [Planctomycetota bacterium]